MTRFGFDTEPVKLTLITKQSVEEHPALADTVLDHALRYADLGWYVIPVRKDKRPIEGYGLNSATKDPGLIRKIWTEHPDANIAVACEKSNLVVLDIDPRSGGLESLAKLEAEHGIIYSAVVSETQGGGEHRVFKAQPEASYPGSLGAGLDLKYRGYILVEPSRGLSGVYRWRAGKNPTQGSLPTDAPALLASPRPTAEASTVVKLRPGSLVESPSVYDDLEQALSVIPPEIKHDAGWLRIMQAMTRLADREKAHRIAKDWSLRSRDPHHTEEAFEAKWRSLSREDSVVSPKTVFYLAAQYEPDWRRSQKESTVTEHPLSLQSAHDAGAATVHPIEYAFDRFMSTGVNIIAGAAGVGKTTLIIPLALTVAHLCPADSALRPRLRRNVIIITESVIQVQRTIYSVAQWGNTGFKPQEFNARVAVIQAHRLEPKKLAAVAQEYAAWTVDNMRADGTILKALPLVVLDTANAVLELENENDNSEVGRAMATIKVAFQAFPLLIIAHMAKQLGFAETDGVGSRGASAWTGDAHGVYTVFKDGEEPDAPRVLKATKVRFQPRWAELGFELVLNQEQHPNVLGELENEWFSHSVARPLGVGERVQIKLDKKAEKEADAWCTLCDEMLQLIRDDPGHARSYYEQLPKTRGGPAGSQERKERAMQSLINDGSVVVVKLDKPRGKATHFVQVAEAVVDSINKGRYQL